MALCGLFNKYRQSDGLLHHRLPLESGVLRHVFHMLYYEQKIALPSVRQWLGEPLKLTEEEYDEDAIWGDGQDLEIMLAQLQEVRVIRLLLSVLVLFGSVFG